MAPESVRRLVAAARRRLFAASMLARSVAWIGAAAALAAALAAVARYWVIEWADAVAVGLVAGAVLLAVVWSIFRRPSTERTAIAVDRRLGGYDRMATALELGADADPGPLERRQLEAAGAWAEARQPHAVASLMPDRRAVALSALAVVVLAALLLVPAPADVALAARQAEREVVADEADRIDALAEETPGDVGERLDALAHELRQVPDIDSALDRLGEARQDLAESLDPTALARRTGLAGLEHSFDQQPVGEGRSAAEQVEDLAARLEGGDPAGAAEAVSRLRQSSEDAAGVDPALSSTLGDAADALERLAAGDAGSAEAADALRRAADAVRSAHERAADQQAIARAAGELAEAQRRLSGQGAGQGAGQGQGEGAGQGAGEGVGQGQGAGGAGGGNGGGGQQSAGAGEGTSGSGMGVGGSGDEDPNAAPQRSSVFDPLADALGPRERVELAPGDDSGEVQGMTDGRGGVQNLPLTPYTDRIGEYRDTALEAVDSLVIPPSVRDVVREYFTGLQP